MPARHRARRRKPSKLARWRDSPSDRRRSLMANDLIRLFAEDDGVVPFTTRGKEQLVLRAKQADDLRNSNAMRLLMTELYGNQPGYGQTESDIFPNPAEQRYG